MTEVVVGSAKHMVKGRRTAAARNKREEVLVTKSRVGFKLTSTLELRWLQTRLNFKSLRFSTTFSPFRNYLPRFYKHNMVRLHFIYIPIVS